MALEKSVCEAPHAEYVRRRDDRRDRAAHLEKLERAVGLSRLGVFLAAAILAWFAFWRNEVMPAWLIVPGATFIVLVIWHDRINRNRARAIRGLEFYERGLARLEDRWAGQGEPGNRFLDENHPYSLDLDIFGAGSIFERLCRARTRGGEDTLARWLTYPAGPAEVRARHEAVRDLCGRLDLREDLDLLGANVRAVVDPEGLAAWGKTPPILEPSRYRLPAYGLVAITLATLALWQLLDVSWDFFLAALIVQSGFALVLRARVVRIIGTIDKKARDLALLATVLARIEVETVRADRLRQLKARLETAGQPPSARIARLGRLCEQLNWRRNQLFAPLAALLLWGTHHALALEAWRKLSGPAIEEWVSAVGEFEALLALAAYSYENPEDPFPEIVGTGPLFHGEDLGHPLLPRAQCVKNDVELGMPIRLLIVSGSNMSGKSTLLRTVGANVVLALAGAPVRACRLRLSPLRVGATLRTQDSLQAGRSRFYAEITRIRALVELVGKDPPVLFLLDELFQGTNSHDRRLGAQAVVKNLVEMGAMGLITTHDLALTHIAQDLGSRAANVHFEDHLENGAMTFDYRMHPGIVEKSNALALMRAVGLLGELPSADTDGKR
jgi:hypothetical protein